MMAVVAQAAQAAADDSEEVSSDDISTPDKKKGLTTLHAPVSPSAAGCLILMTWQVGRHWTQGSEPRQGSRRRSSIGESARNHLTGVLRLEEKSNANQATAAPPPSLK